MIVHGINFDNFRSFSLDRNFDEKSPSLSHKTSYGPLTPRTFSEKTSELISRKLAEGRKDRKKGGP